MYHFSFLLKTCRKDFKYVKRLLDSYIKFNSENIHLFLVTEKESIQELKSSVPQTDNENITILPDNLFYRYFTQIAIGELSAGYVNQEIVKLAFHRLGLSANYLALDSDAFFIRSFYYKDFMYNEYEPYTVLYEESEFYCDPQYYKNFSIKKKEWLKNICKVLQFDHSKICSCHGFQIISSAVMEKFEETVLEQNQYTYVDLMKIAPLEFSWYSIFLQKSNVINIHPCGEIFKTFHTSYDHALSLVKNISLEDYARGYVGIVINSNISSKHLCEYKRISHYRFQLNIRRLAECIFISAASNMLSVFYKRKDKEIKRETGNVKRNRECSKKLDL